MHDNVFLSYAKEDFVTAEKIFDFLSNHNYIPWLDKKKLLPGMEWDFAIRRALKEADFIILLLSENSIAKRGYVQREFKLALEYCEEKLDSDIYIIPCKIDNCNVPDKLTKFQWVELDGPDSFELILRSLNTQKKQYEEAINNRNSSEATFDFKNLTIKKNITGIPSTNVDIIYPQFNTTSNEDLKILNNFIEHLVYKNYSECFQQIDHTLFPDQINEEDVRSDFQLQMSFKFELLSPHFLSYTMFTYTYSGGAHGLYGTSGYNYRLNPLLKFSLETLLDQNTDSLKTLKLLCKEKLMRKAKEEMNIEKEENFFIIKDPLELKWDTFKNFYLTRDGIVIIFNIYQITPYMLGQHEVEISFNEILSRHKDLKTLTRVQGLLSSNQ